MALPTTAIPYGLRQVKLTAFTDATATVYNASSVALPYNQTLTFADTENFSELRGDDSLVTVHGQGTVVNWELEAGGISMDAYAVLAGGEVTTTGVTPNISKKLTKYTTHANQNFQTRPYFKAEGRAISDSGGDFHIVLYRCRATDDVKGELKDGEFWTTGAKGQGLGSFVPADLNKAYDFIHNESPVVVI